MEKSSLFDNSSDSEIDLGINKVYAEKYDKWRSKEEFQKLKDKYGDESLSSSSESEDEPLIDRDFLKTLSLLKSKDPKIYDAEATFFAEEGKEKTPKEKEAKPLMFKQYEIKVLLEDQGEASDENTPTMGPNYIEEQEEIKKSFADALECSDEENDDFLKVRSKTKTEAAEDDREYMLWMKTKERRKESDENKDLECLHDLWNDPKLDEGEQFLRDYILNEKYVSKKDPLPTYDEIVNDVVPLSDDEKILEEQELYEHKFNFRFEEPDPEFIKRYPRMVKDSLRRPTDKSRKRRTERDEYRERKLKEKEQKKEELLRLKALKRQEIQEKLAKLKEVTGNEKLAFEDVDMNGDFDLQEHDRRMNELFGDQYYEVEEEEMPTFPQDEEFDFEDWDNWTGNDDAEGYADEDYNNDLHCEDPNFNMDADYDPRKSFQKEMIDSLQHRTKKRKKSKFASAVSQKKPIFDPSSKTFEDYFDEYYKLDYEDIIDDLPCRFKYRKVVPNDFGLSVDEILCAKDQELNRWCSLKKALQYRPEQEELYDVQAFQKRSQNESKKRKIFFSLYENSDAKDSEAASHFSDKQSKKRKRDEEDVSDVHDVQSLQEESQKEKISPSLHENCDSNDPEVASPTSDKKLKKRKRKKELVSQSEMCVNVNNSDAEQYNLKKSIPSTSYGDNNSTLTLDEDFTITSSPKIIKETEVSFSVCENDNSKISQNSSPGCDEQQSKKKKNKKKHGLNNRAASTTDSEAIQEKKKGKSIKKRFNPNKTEDKRLALSDERLRAYGINPKKFKTSIKYSQKQQPNS